MAVKQTAGRTQLGEFAPYALTYLHIKQNYVIIKARG